ncbi:MAG: DUF4398 domain-containing protein [Betaproteobacteria bacterium]|nr:DUF4398 domain-containing protein [Betaproteobacteria bacterium]
MNNPIPARRRLAGAGLLASLLLLGACATAELPPTAELAAANAALTQAESAGAQRWAPVELLAAREKLSRADAAVREERFGDARRLAEAAEADALLADRKTRAVNAQQAAEELVRSNELLRREAERNVRR